MLLLAVAVDCFNFKALLHLLDTENPVFVEMGDFSSLFGDYFSGVAELLRSMWFLVERRFLA